MVSQISIAYQDSYLTNDSKVGKVKAGDRMPYFITVTGKPVYDSLMAPEFKLLFFGTAEIKKDILSKCKIPCEICCFKDIPAFLFGKEKDFYILLRPDNHISYIGKDINRCHTFLDKISVY